MSTLPSKLENLVRTEFEDTCKRRFFFGPAFEPYGGTSGLYDFGPVMCAIKANFLQLWRQHFVIEESMSEVDTTCMTPEEVFIASGHVERFNDVMTRDTVTGECFRLDKLLEEYFEKLLAEGAAFKKAEYEKMHRDVGAMSSKELGEVVAKYGVKSAKGNPLSDPFEFNLMFSSYIGPEGTKKGYLRPELAQGIFLNFKRLIDSNNARMPFAGAAIGQAFRNEIAPRAALIRVREFTLAEIEHFLNPNDKSHPKFDRVRGFTIWAWPRQSQEEGTEPFEITVGEAVEKRIIDNQSLGYFIARTAMLFHAIGIKYVRFRQHRAKEMAHYAQDCWDAECLTSYGWVECVGHADRSAYDLTKHTQASGKELSTREEYPEPRIERMLERKVNKAAVGKAMGKEAGQFFDAVNALSETDAMAVEEELAAKGESVITTCDGKKLPCNRAMVQFAMKDQRVTGRNYIPSVIEPSFGVGRILYALLEQNYWVRRDEADTSGKNEKRAVFSFMPVIAPQKVAIFPLMMKPELEPLVERIRDGMVALGLPTRIDDSGVAIGKKYARVDELGIPFCVTVDFETDGRVTLRERDTTKQVRVPIDEVCSLVQQLSKMTNPLPWDDVLAKYPEQISKDK